jgi:hypothetical protein
MLDQAEAEKILHRAYELKRNGHKEQNIASALCAMYEYLELAQALVVIATQFNWKRP